MLTDVKVVIGANFGDEGKGLMTDYFASKDENSIVVRFNGGSQAGHTVVAPDGTEHIFSHYGSGGLLGRPTYLSKHFIVNPIMFVREYAVLSERDLDATGYLYVDGRCRVTTPYDMLINQAAEMSRAANKHGSCGLGISETVVRSEYGAGEYTLSVLDIFDLTKFRAKLLKIRAEYVPMRLAELEVVVPAILSLAIESDDIIEAYMLDATQFLINIKLSDTSILGSFKTIVFEGAQGLLLDQDLVELSPYITHSSTGVKNVTEILFETGLTYTIEICYVTRAYLTRHGAGPMEGEIEGLPYSGVVDTTNIPNEWQGALRFGILNLDSLKETIFKDFDSFAPDGARVTLAITCLDQVDEKVKFIIDGEEQEVLPEDFPYVVDEVLETAAWIYGSWGRTRSSIRRYM